MSKQALTLDEIEAMPCEMLNTETVARCMGVAQYSINLHAKAGTLPFNYIMNGNRVKIPKRAFVAFMRGEKAET